MGPPPRPAVGLQPRERRRRRPTYGGYDDGQRKRTLTPCSLRPNQKYNSSFGAEITVH